MNLYELVGERLALQHKLEELNFDSETVADTLEGDSLAITTKITNYGYVIKNMASFRGEMQRDIDRQQLRLDKYMKREDAIKDWLQKNMEICGISKIDCPAFSVTLRKNPPSVVIDDERQLTDAYMRLPVIKPPVAVPDKAYIKQCILAGTDVPGARLVQNNRLVIE